jgi:uncharacterized circularly permuted ATP-grasp superfamily protein/uncharacterized alpha-E superfamily protein
VKVKTDKPARDAGLDGVSAPLPPWSEVLDESGRPRASYGPLLDRLAALPRPELRLLDQRMEATMRELGVSFDLAKGSAFGQKPWSCDVLPHVFSGDEWSLVVRGLRQRMRAFELFLRDVYGAQEILRLGVVPIAPVLGSPHFQRPAVHLAPANGRYLHLGAICLKREPGGALQVSSQHFGHATGVSYMVQNRRVLARVAPETFSDLSVSSIAETPTAILEALRETADLSLGEPLIVMLSPGPGNPFYTEHSFLARRMGVPLVQGGDLLVLDDHVYLKTIGGLERVHVIYNRVVDQLLDPMVLERGSTLGVPGLVHCVRKQTVSLVNALGSQLADDRALLTFAPRIIRFYLGEAPILATMPTFWCGDPDQREVVLSNLPEYRILPRTGDRLFGNKRGLTPTANEEAALRQEIRRKPELYVAQPITQGAKTLCFEGGVMVDRRQDQLVFALQKSSGIEVFPGALTRIAPEGSLFTAAGLGGGSKDTWVLSADAEPITLQSRPRRPREIHLPNRRVTSRVAEVFYWMGRYLERANNLAYIIQVVETLELEELNATERKLYRPMWNRLLPHLDGSGRRSIATACDRYRLVLQPDEPGALTNVLRRALNNADAIQDALSPEAWTALSRVRTVFARHRFQPDPDNAVCARVTRKLSEMTTHVIPQFFGLAESSMMSDDGWRFCLLGQQLERAIITANAPLACSKAFTGPADRPAQLGHHTEIELSAFLRLLGTRDAYRRVYQMRAEPLPVLRLLFQNPEAPRSVLHSLQNCAALLKATDPEQSAVATQRTLSVVSAFCERLRRTDWAIFFDQTTEPAEDFRPPEPAPAEPPLPPPVWPDNEVSSLTTAATTDVPAAALRLPELQARQTLKTSLTPGQALSGLLGELIRGTMNLHNVIADVFLNHQAHISTPVQPYLKGFPRGI